MSESTLKIGTRSEGNVTVVEVDGVLDARTTPDLNARLKELTGAGHVRLVIDMTPLKYIASAGIGSLFAAKKEAKKQGGDLRIAGARKEIKDVFDLLNFTAAFQMTEQVAKAVKGF